MLKDCLIYGRGPRRVLVVAPLMSSPPDESFAREWFEPFFPSHTLLILDPLTKMGELQDWSELVAHFKSILEGESFNEAWGFSLGGCILQKISHSLALDGSKLFLISTSSAANHLLKNRLAPIISHLLKGKLDDALKVKSQLVLKGNQSFPMPKNQAEALKRLLRGFELVCSCDAREEMNSLKEQAIYIFGKESKLMNFDTMGPIFHHKSYALEHCGMRVTVESPEEYKKILKGEFQ